MTTTEPNVPPGGRVPYGGLAGTLWKPFRPWGTVLMKQDAWELPDLDTVSNPNGCVAKPGVNTTVEFLLKFPDGVTACTVETYRRVQAPPSADATDSADADVRNYQLDAWVFLGTYDLDIADNGGRVVFLLPAQTTRGGDPLTFRVVTGSLVGTPGADETFHAWYRVAGQ